MVILNGGGAGGVCVWGGGVCGGEVKCKDVSGRVLHQRIYPSCLHGYILLTRADIILKLLCAPPNGPVISNIQSVPIAWRSGNDWPFSE